MEKKTSLDSSTNVKKNGETKKLTNLQIERQDALSRGTNWNEEQLEWGELRFGMPSFILESWLLLGSDYNARREETRSRFRVAAILNVAEVKLFFTIIFFAY